MTQTARARDRRAPAEPCTRTEFDRTLSETARPSTRHTCTLRVARPREPRGTPRTRYFVRIIAGPGRGVELPIDAPRTLVGRGPGADLALHDTALSRTHLVLEPVGSAVRVTTVNPDDTFTWRGREVREAWVPAGEVVRVGRVRLEIGEYRWSDEERVVGAASEIRGPR